jgi:adenylate cyclase
LNRHALLIGLGFALTLLFIGGAARLYDIPLSRELGELAYDSKLRLTIPHTTDDRIVILDIDEKSLKEEGHWPWRRDRMALLLDKLFDRDGVAEVGFDIVFAEPDESSGLQVLEKLGHDQLRGVPRFQSALNEIRPKLEYDRIFADKLKGRNVVLGCYFTSGGRANASGALPVPTFAPGSFEGARAVPFYRWTGYGGNLPEFQRNAAATGHINPIVDPDGMVRRLPMIVEYKGAYYDSLSLAMVRVLLGPSRLVPVFEGGELQRMELLTARGRFRIPMDDSSGEGVSTLVPYRGPQGSFRYISVTDVLHDRIPESELRGKIVLVGTSAPGLQDLRSTPVASTFPGVEVHANMIAGILGQSIKQRPGYMVGVEVLLMLLLGGSLSLLLPRLSPIRGAIAAVIALTLVVALDFWLWQLEDLDLPVANSVMLLSALFVLNMWLGYFMAERRKRQITSLFGQYVPAELVEEMSQRPEEVSMEGDSREMTILFSDVRGFTSVSERFEPKELSRLMNEFLTPFTRVIHGHRGTIDKYMGDCIMAFWGAPLHSKDHARDAVLAGMEMFRVLAELRREFEARGWPALRMGIGINTGRVSVGNMGSEVRVAYTVMGDAVNIASRLESLTKQYRVDFIVGEDTRRAVPGVVYRELDLVRVKGKDEPVAIYEPVGLEGEVSADVLEEIGLFHQALNAYRNRAWDEAELQLLSLHHMHPKARLYQVFAERIAEYRVNPPAADWNGVFDWKTK